MNANAYRIRRGQMSAWTRNPNRLLYSSEEDPQKNFRRRLRGEEGNIIENGVTAFLKAVFSISANQLVWSYFQIQNGEILTFFGFLVEDEVERQGQGV